MMRQQWIMRQAVMSHCQYISRTHILVKISLLPLVAAPYLTLAQESPLGLSEQHQL
jgi:hypothetical protein